MGIKAAILIRYGINEEEYRRRFRSARRKDEETNRELAVKLMEWQAKWLKECHTVEDVMNAVGKEQFLNTLPTDKKWWVLDRKPETHACIQAGKLAEDYEQARRPETETLASSTPKPNREGVSTVESRVMPRKTAIRGKEKKVNKAEVYSVLPL